MGLFTPRQLREIGEHLWGRDWQTRLGDKLARSAKTIRRWEREGAIPPDVKPKLREIIQDQIAVLAADMATLERDA